MRLPAAFAVLLLLVGCAGIPATCALTEVATLPLVGGGSHAVVAGRLNGVDVRYVLDTGAETSHVTPEAAGRARLPAGPGTTRIEGMGGTIVVSEALADLELGGMAVQRMLPVAPLPLRAEAGQVFGGLIGADLLSDFELEVSFPEHRVRLWRAAHCAGDYVPWAGLRWAVPLRQTIGQRLMVSVRVDGTFFSALLDTGANGTMLGVEAARRLGLGPAVMARERGVASMGVDGNRVQAHVRRFGTLGVGPETVNGPLLLVSGLEMPEGEMVLGTDWLRSRRVWISWGSGQMFVQPKWEIR